MVFVKRVIIISHAEEDGSDTRKWTSSDGAEEEECVCMCTKHGEGEEEDEGKRNNMCDERKKRIWRTI